MNGSVPLRTRRLLLRPFETMDYLDVYQNFAGDPEVSRWLTWDAHASPEETFSYLLYVAPKYEMDDYYHYAIELPTVGVIGAIGAVEIDKERKEATVGYCLGTLFQRQGFMSEALEAFLGYLEEEGFHRFKARCLIDNAASIALLKKHGFLEIGPILKSVKGQEKKLLVFEKEAGVCMEKTKDKENEAHFDTSLSIDPGNNGFDLDWKIDD